ncbi:hypothetical protein PVAP13_4KG110835 [Panicum virgatum]|uniref:Uncharacterized protein n=1 Tax=Panicum virgatum TaxID=38727 RepID=A0A8T0TVE5_PANVG|nr:hypothetical protein PVAP13_4KG110835 [Panicum virgatum]
MKCGSYGLASVNCRSHRSCTCSPLSHPFGSPLFPSPSPLLDTHHQDGSSGERPSPSPPRARPGCLLCVCHDEPLADPDPHGHVGGVCLPQWRLAALGVHLR